MKTKERSNGFFRRLGRAAFDYIEHTYLAFFTLPLAIYILIESLSQQRVFGAFALLFERPLCFLCNLMIIYLTYCAVLFVRRRVFAYVLTTFVWLALGITNFVLLGMRNSPFCATDVLIFRYGFIITLKYMKPWQIILIGGLVIGLVVGFVMLFRRGGRHEGSINKLRAAVISGSCLVLGAVLIIAGLWTGHLEARYDKPRYGYTRYGFCYSFACSIFVQGVEKPDDYSQNRVDEVVAGLKSDLPEPEKKPNIVMLQLESFFDIDRMQIVTGSDPIPNFHRLYDENPSGALEVHTLGGGTSNTEFEVLTGMDLEFFGTVEFPYESYVYDNACESIAYDLKEAGYHTDAIHTFSAGFYNRDRVFSNLGFDRFTSFEYMTELEYNELGWVKDTVLAEYVKKALAVNEKPEFVFGISVQGHGSYPTDFRDTGMIAGEVYEDEAVAAQIDYYISQLRETDEMIGQLTQALAEFDEPTVLVLYGDHIPGIALTEDMIEGGLYKTEYVVWANFELAGEDRDICTYQLSAHVLDLLGIHNGTFTKYHQQCGDSPDYKENLKLLEYDVVNGDMHVYKGKSPYEPTALRFGVTDIKLKKAEIDGEALYVYGEGFNESTTVYLNGMRRSTELVDVGCVVVRDADAAPGDTVCTAQQSHQNYFSMLGYTDEIKVKLKSAE